MRILIACALLFVFIASAEAGVIKNILTNVFGGRGSNTNGNSQQQPAGCAENEQRTPGQSVNSNDDNCRRLTGSQEKPSGQYGAAGTYTKRPLVVGGTTERYKNTSGYIENGDYLSPNGNESKQQQQQGEKYGAAGTYTIRPNVATQKQPGYGDFGTGVANQQQTPSEFFNNNNNNFSHRNDQRPTQGGTTYSGNGETVRSSIQNQNAPDSIVLKSNEITCTYSNLREEVEKRKLRCAEDDCTIDQVYEKSSLWVCGPLKCTVASADFSKDQGNKTLLECHFARHIIEAPIRCGPDEKEVRGKCRKIFN